MAQKRAAPSICRAVNFTFDGATKDPMQQAVRDALSAFMAATAQAGQGLAGWGSLGLFHLSP